ncbi:exosome component 10 [Episyrphus balteatus]|uniref:exosome component 10 n=1 Tax=Episyrphus balteatus TaxID=286459 RepID=UPI002486307C|nr:exosome component 10 [Episyrphus balteatus]
MNKQKNKQAPPETSGTTPKKPKTQHKIGDQTIEEFAKTGLGKIINATKTINAFPSGASRDLYCAYPTFGKIVDSQSYRIMSVISKVLKFQNIKGNIQRRQQDEQFEMLLECNDAMLERINSNLDELAGIKKNPQTVVIESRLDSDSVGKGAGSWNTKNRNEPGPIRARLITAKNIARPQIKFKMIVDNSAKTPFIPNIKDKPNSLKPLAVLPEYDEAGNIESYLHPYEFELMKFEPLPTQLKKKNPVAPLPLEKTELVYVDTIDKLKSTLEDLRKFKEIAIDVEHHSYRTFQGITCLMQISTREKDYILDALELRDELHILNEVFTNPKVVKILHGADSDVEWLQRDLSLYLVNMFDTHQAAKSLNFARLSLAYLLKHYCEIEADKTFQLADWRIRPLPEELITYARQDTHNLIYIYERLTNDLLDLANNQTNILRLIYQRSAEICKKRYKKPKINDDSHMDIFQKSKKLFDNRQLFALKEIFLWRDVIARQEDESYGYVLPNHMMMQISESLPREMQGILACCNPIPPLVRQNLHALHQIIHKAREQPLVKPILERDNVHRTIVSNVKDYNSKLYCPHDLSHLEEFRDDLPTLLKSSENQADKSTESGKLCKPALSVFDTPENSEDDEVKEKLKKLQQMQFISPYARYVAVLPLVEIEKKEELARIEAENAKKQLCPIKSEMPQKTEAIVKNEADNLYSVPLRESLKRKNPESSNPNNNQSAQGKRIKKETPASDGDHLKFMELKRKAPEVSNTSNQQEVEEEDEEPSSTSSNQTTPHSGQKHSNNGNNRKNRKRFKGNKVAQSSEKPVAFDYKKVDFKKFQGGAQKAKGTELKPKFHGKGGKNKANNKKFNKLFTFSNVKNKK